MKVLFVASESTDGVDLTLTQEITELQRRFYGSAVNPIIFHLLPDLKVEDIPGELSRFMPDILHIASHASDNKLSLSDHGGRSVEVTAEMLAAFVSPVHPPRLVYLNSCNSESIAKRLVEIGAVPMAIGSTAPISNRAARASAVAFYERLLTGLSVQTAAETCGKMLEALTQPRCTAVLHKRSNVEANIEVLYTNPVLIADFGNEKAKPEKNGSYVLRLGILGCPAGTCQVVFFTDDETFVEDVDTYEDDLSLIARTAPVDGILWADDSYWTAFGDHRLYAVGVLSGGGSFTLEGTLCQAIETRYRRSPAGSIPSAVADALTTLRMENGADLEPMVKEEKGKRTK